MSSTATSTKSPLSVVTDFFFSSVGAKFLMAATGIVLWGFTIGHMLGNLQVFAPALKSAGINIEAYQGQLLNDYAHTLKTTPLLLWGTRITLLICFPLHILMGIRLKRLSVAARPVAYHTVSPRKSTLASRHMALSGIIFLAFLIFHLFQFTLTGGPDDYLLLRDQVDQHDVFSMVVHAFSNPIYVVIYLIGVSVVVTHLYHGSQSLWQSIGFRHKAWTPIVVLVGRIAVAAILVGNLAMPTVIFIWSLSGFKAPTPLP